MDDEKLDRALSLLIDSDDHPDDMTVRDFLRELLGRVWEFGERFDSKRPFGNSGWQSDLCRALIRAGIVDGVIDEAGYVARCDEEEVDDLVFRLIDRVFDLHDAHCRAQREASDAQQAGVSVEYLRGWRDAMERASATMADLAAQVVMRPAHLDSYQTLDAEVAMVSKGESNEQ